MSRGDRPEASRPGSLQQELDELRAQMQRLQGSLQTAEHSEQRLEAALWSSGLAWWEWDLEQNNLIWGQRVLELLGFMPQSDSADQGQLYPIKSIIHPDDLPDAQKAMQHYLRGWRGDYLARYRIRTSSGDWRWFLDRGTVTRRAARGEPLCLVGSLEDISREMSTAEERERLNSELQRLNAELEQRVNESTDELRSANEELRIYQVELETQNEELRSIQLRLEESRDRLTHLYDFAPLAYFTVDRDGLILEANLKFATMLGVNRNRLMHKPMSVFLTSESQEPLFKFRQRLLETLRPQTTEILMQRRDGESFHARLEGVPEMTFSGPTGRVRIAMMDISEQKQAQVLREDVERMARHDLKTPLNAIIGLPRIILMDHNLTQEQRELLAQVEESGYNMLHSINLSLDMFKMERGTYEFTPEAVDLLDMLRKSAREMRSLTDSRNLRWLVMVQGRAMDGSSPPFFIQSEPMLCYIMLANLMKNAFEAAPEGSTVTVSLEQHEAHSCITIHNQGVIPPAVRERFFEKYITTGKKGGTGLGTYSARLIAQTHGGDIHFETSEESGTSLSIVLPYRPAA